MSTLVSALKHEITRLARKEVAAGTVVLRRANAQYRRDLRVGLGAQKPVVGLTTSPRREGTLGVRVATPPTTAKMGPDGSARAPSAGL